MSYLRRKNTDYYGTDVPADEPVFVPRPAKSVTGGAAYSADSPLDPAQINEDENSLRSAPGSKVRMKPVLPADLSQSGAIGNMTQMAAGGVLNQAALAALKTNEDKRRMLKTMPVTENTDINQTGRIKSGLRALVEGLATMFDPRFGVVRDMPEFYARMAAAGGRAIGGTINPDWDEYRERDQKLAELDADDARIQQRAEFENKMATSAANRADKIERTGIAKTRAQIAADQLTERKNQNLIANLREEQKLAIKTAVEGDRYIHGAHPETDQKLADLGIYLSDFDKNLKPKQNNGVWEAYNFKTKQYEPMAGLDQDVDEVPLMINVDGQNITASTKAALGYLGAKERQQTQIDAQRNLQDDRQKFQERMKNISREDDAVQEIQRQYDAGAKLLSERKIDAPTFNRKINAVIDLLPENLRDALRQRFKPLPENE